MSAGRSSSGIKLAKVEIEGRALSSTAAAIASRAEAAGPGRAGGARCAEPGTAPLPVAAALLCAAPRP